METQSWEFESLSAGTPEPGQPPTPASPNLGGPPPVEPPRRLRPDPAGFAPLSGSTTTPPLAPIPEPAAPGTEPEALIATTPGWGWRAFTAFVAGGLLTAGGFAVGQRTFDEAQTAQAEVVPATAPVAQTTVPSRATPTPLIEDGTAEPAQLVAELLGPSVVQIETEVGLGSGVIYDDGLILTNNHVIQGSETVTVRFSDGRHLQGTVLGAAPNVDIAVVSVGDGQDLQVAQLATGEKPQVGQTAIAIGSPFSLQQTVTVGIVSAVDRPLEMTTQSYTAMIQTDAPINPGNSGGALADRHGRVIGINTAIQTGGNSNTNAGVGFAIPIDTAISVAERIVAGEPIEAGLLGVEGGQSSDGSAGVELKTVTEGSAADLAGLQIGDRILSIDGAPVTNIQELAGLVIAHRPGDVIELEVIRAGQPLTVQATLGQR